MKKINSILISVMLICGLMLSGCSIAQRTMALDTVNVVSKANVLKGQYDIVSTIIERHQNDFSKEELDEFVAIDQNAQEIYTKIDGLLKLEDFNISPSEIKYLYSVAKDSYFRAKDIVEKHENVFTPYEITKLRMFDIQLQEMDKAVKKMMENPDTMNTRKMLGTILQVASISLKVVLPLVL